MPGLNQPTLIVEFAPSNNALDASPTWVDITQYVMHVSTKRGRQHELNRVEAGTASLTLLNIDARFNPWNTASPYYNSGTGLVPMKPIRIRATWNGITYNLWRGFVDAWPMTWADSNSAEVTISCTDGFKVLNLSKLPSSYAIEVMKDSPFAWWRFDEPSLTTVAIDSSVNAAAGKYAVGKTTAASLVGGDSGASSVFGTAQFATFPNLQITGTVLSVEAWINTTSPGFFVVDQILSDSSHSLYLDSSHLGPNGHVTFQFRSSSVESSVAVNDGLNHHILGVYQASPLIHKIYVDGVDVTLGTPSAQAAISHPNPTIGKWTTAVSVTIDEVAIYSSALTSTRVLAHYNASKNQWSGDLPGPRIARLLDAAGWPTADRALDTGNSVLQGAGALGVVALAHAQTVTDSEDGIFFIDPAGRAVFYDRYHGSTGTTSATSQVTLGDGAGEEPYELAGTQVGIDELDLWNELEVSSQGQSVQTVGDAASKTLYGRRTLSKTALLNGNTGDLNSLANRLLSRYKTPTTRVSSVTVHPLSDPSVLYPHVLARELQDRVTFKRQPPGGGSTFSVEALIEGVAHNITPDDWVTTWNLSVTDAVRYWVIGSSAIGTDTRIG